MTDMSFVNELLRRNESRVAADALFAADRNLEGSPPPLRREPSADLRESMDAETLEVVLKFEELYTEAPLEQPTDSGGFGVDDLLGDLPEGLATPAAAAERVQRPAAAAVPAPEVLRVTPIQEAAQLEVSLDEAMALLRAAEQRGQAAALKAARDAHDEDEPVAEAFVPKRKAFEPPPQTLPDPFAPYASEARHASRAPSIKIVAVALVALTIGAAGGFFAAHGGAAASDAKIQVLQDGGAQLRLDYELRSSR